MVAAFIKGLLKRQVTNLAEQLAEEIVLESMVCEQTSEVYRTAMLCDAAMMVNFDADSQRKVMSRVKRQALRFNQLVGGDLYDVEGRMRSVFTARGISGVRLFQFLAQQDTIAAEAK